KSESDITYSVRIHETISGEESESRRYLYNGIFLVEAGSETFIPYSGTWKSADDETALYDIRVHALAEIGGVNRTTTWDFTTDFIPVFLGLD
ncbi:MAG: hypothetical protein LBR74_02435, partial [Eubacterium sp.]|nr:hypothetical protein [Eubacterium sp.]